MSSPTNQFPHRDFIKLVLQGDPIKVQRRLMSSSDKELAIALTYLGDLERDYVYSCLSKKKADSIRTVLLRGGRFGREERNRFSVSFPSECGEQRISIPCYLFWFEGFDILYLNRHLEGEKPLGSLKSYYRPSR